MRRSLSSYSGISCRTVQPHERYLQDYFPDQEIFRGDEEGVLLSMGRSTFQNKFLGPRLQADMQ